MKTPITPAGLIKYDHLPAGKAARQAWNGPGEVPQWHEQAQTRVQRAAPRLSHAAAIGDPEAMRDLWEGTSPRTRQAIRDVMPLLARALDRL